MSSASHLFFLLAAALVALALLRRDDGRAAMICGPLALLLVAATLDSPTRRVGDATEYLVMARNLATFRPPSALPTSLSGLREETATFGDRSWVQDLNPKLTGRDGRIDFEHFWLLPLVAAPAVAIARLGGMHPAVGFTALNLACLLVLVWVVARRAGREMAVLVACALLWWTDKVHAEVFLATTLILGLLWLEDHPVRALIVLSFATAQVPLFGCVLAVAAAAALLRSPRDGRIWAGCAAAFVVASLHPAYYLWHIGRLSPLPGALSWNVPGVHLLVTPLLDPNVGIVWYGPALAGLACMGLVRLLRTRSWPPAALIAAGVGFAATLVAAAQMPNVSHGATPGPSRHGLWCLVLVAPFAVYAAVHVTRRQRVVLVGATLLTLLFSAQVMHPRNPDVGTPTTLAHLLWTRAPGLDNPVPEIFAERIAGVDGPVPVPTATAHCEKVLLVGDGRQVRWPAWCRPLLAPNACAARGAYCYSNNGQVVTAPRFSRFDASEPEEWRTLSAEWR